MPDNPIVAALPGGGWRAVYRGDDREIISSPIIAWLVHQDGEIVPQDVDCHGHIEDPTTASNFIRLEHPTDGETTKES